MKVLLYSAIGSSNSGRVEWALNFNSIPYQRVEATVTTRTPRIRWQQVIASLYGINKNIKVEVSQ